MIVVVDLIPPPPLPNDALTAPAPSSRELNVAKQWCEKYLQFVERKLAFIPKTHKRTT